MRGPGGDPLNLIRVMPAKGQGRVSAPTPSARISTPHPEEAAERGRLEGWATVDLMLRDGPSALLSMRVGKGCADEQANLRQGRSAAQGDAPGRLSGSRKVYSSPQGHDDVQVPFREIALTDGEPSFQRLRHVWPLHRRRGRISTSIAGSSLCARPGSQRAAAMAVR